MNKDSLLEKIKKNLILEHDEDDDLIRSYITAAVSLCRSYQHLEAGTYTENPMHLQPNRRLSCYAATSMNQEMVLRVAFADNTSAGEQVWNTVNLLLRLDRNWKV